MRGNPPAADVIVEILEATDLRVGDLNGILFVSLKISFNAGLACVNRPLLSLSGLH